MKNSVLFLIILCSITLSAQNKVSHYKHLVFRETPFAKTKGRIEISKERALKENNYKLTYNDLGKLILVEYNIGGKLIGTRRSGMLDGNRNLMTKTKIAYKDSKEIRTFYDEYGNQRNNFMGVYKEVYSYDKNNKRVGLQYFDEDDKPVNNSWKIFEYFWKHKGNNDIVEKRKNTKGVYVPMRSYYNFMTTLYKFTDEGILLSMNNIDENGNLS